jgi:hypothetical protein
MGTSRSGAQLAAKFDKVGRVVLEGNERKVKRGAEIVRTSVLALAVPKTGGDLKFSGAGNKRLGVSTKLVSGGQNAQAVARAIGPMHWLEGGVKPHGVAPKGSGGSRAARSAAAGSIGRGVSGVSFNGRGGFLRFADGTIAKYARNAGGLPASNVWSNGVDRAAPLYGKDATAQTVRDMSSVF